MHGLEGLDKSGLTTWDVQNAGTLIFDDDFDLSPTANQEAMINMCEDL